MWGSIEQLKLVGKFHGNAWLCNHKGTKIRVSASEIKSVSIQPIVSSFVGGTDSRQCLTKYHKLPLKGPFPPPPSPHTHTCKLPSYRSISVNQGVLLSKKKQINLGISPLLASIEME